MESINFQVSAGAGINQKGNTVNVPITAQEIADLQAAAQGACDINFVWI